MIKWATIVYFRQMALVDVYQRGELNEDVERITRFTIQERIDASKSIEIVRKLRDAHGADLPILHFDRGWCLKND